MIGRVVGALVGREIDRCHGESGVKGALIGAVALGVLRRVGPPGWALGGAHVARQAFDRRKRRA